MKKLLSLIIILFPFFLKAQTETNFEITVIDSFTVTKSLQEGMVSLRAVNLNDEIHLAYIMRDTSTIAKLIYAIRTDAGFTMETVSTIPNFHNYSPQTALQFDSLGKPHIYIANLTTTGGHYVYAYEKIEGVWQGTFVSDCAYTPKLVADPDGSNELGFAFQVASQNHTLKEPVVYASYNGVNWNLTQLSNGYYIRNKPSIVNHNNKTYVAYGEGRYPDTLATRVHVKENGNWLLTYEDIYNSGYGGGSIDGLYTKLGASAKGVYLLNTLHRIDGHPSFVKNEGSGWQIQTINFEASLTSFVRSPNILFNTNNTAFWINEDNGVNPNLSWIKNNGDGGIIDLPRFHSAIWLHDFVIKNENIYIYYYESSAGFVTFKEVKTNINEIFSGIEPINKLDDYLLKNYPNPFLQSTEISFNLPDDGKVVLNIFNADGKCVNRFLNKTLSQGNYRFNFDAKELPAGMYYYKLSVDGKTSANKMLLVK